MAIKLKKLTSTFLIAVFLLGNISIANAKTTVNAVNETAKNISQTEVEVSQKCDREIIEHLPTYKGSAVNIVKVGSDRVTVTANNVLKVTFSGDFNSKHAQCNERLAFVLNEGLTTVEGRCLLPCGTQILGTIQQIQPPKWMNRNAKVYIIFDEVVLPNGEKMPLCAKPFSKDSSLKNSSWKAVGKAAGYTVGLFGVGAGLGAAIGTVGKASVGCMTYGMPIGAGVGLLAGTITPGLNYKAKEGKSIYIQLVQDFVICCNTCKS